MNTNKAPSPIATDRRCPGCGQSFRGDRGLRAHQSRPFIAMGCRLVAK